MERMIAGDDDAGKRGRTVAGSSYVSNRDQSTPACKLSVCIATHNRAAFIGETLESILVQLTDACELVVVDGASTDETRDIVSDISRRLGPVRYVRRDTNNGIDRDYDHAVELATGQYCWLMTDDDLFKPGAVATVLDALRRELSLVIVNKENRDVTMSRVLQKRLLRINENRFYDPQEIDRLLIDTADIIRFIGCIVIKRDIWIGRARDTFYGSWFIHVGVIFQDRLPGEAMVIADPLIAYRRGNSHTWSPHASEIIFSKWPSIVNAVAVTQETKSKLSGEPWRRSAELLLLRGGGMYSWAEYRRWVRPQLDSMGRVLSAFVLAVVPGVLINALCLAYFSAVPSERSEIWIQVMKESRFHPRNWKPARS